MINEIEWYFSTDQLCEVMDSLKDLELLGVNPGLGDDKLWDAIRYKGGSEPGVLNYTHLLKHKTSGKWICVSATWNDEKKEVESNALDAQVVRLMQLLAR